MTTLSAKLRINLNMSNHDPGPFWNMSLSTSNMHLLAIVHWLQKYHFQGIGKSIKSMDSYNFKYVPVLKVSSHFHFLNKGFRHY